MPTRSGTAVLLALLPVFLGASAPTLADSKASGFFGCPVERDATGLWGNHWTELWVPGQPDEPLDTGVRIPPLPFERLPREQQEHFRQQKPSATFGPLGRGGSSARHLDFWLTAAVEGQQPGDDSPWVTGVDIVLRVRSRRGARWWVLHNQGASQGGRMAGQPMRVERIEAAPGNLALFVVSWGLESPGRGAYISTTRKIALDFRASPPRAVAILECSYADSRRNCDYADGQRSYEAAAFRDGYSIGCQWENTRQAFLCKSTRFAGTDWGGRFWSAFFDLKSGKPVPRPDASGSGPQGVGQFVLSSGQSKMWPRAMVAGVGKLTHLAQFSSRVPGRVLHIVAAPAPGLDFDPRFFLVATDAAGLALTNELTLHDPGAGPHGPLALAIAAGDPAPAVASAPDPVLADTPDGSEPMFGVTNVPGAPAGVHLLQVVATHGRGRGVYWVGVEDDATAPLGQVVRLASDIAYPFCGGREHPTTAVSIEPVTRNGGVEAVLDMEPGYFDLGDANLVREADNREIARKCPWKARVVWRAGEGFEWTSDDSPCERATAPRHIEINSEGSIRIAPPEF